MKKLDLDRPPVLPTEGEFRLFNAIDCAKAIEIYNLRKSHGPIGLMQLKEHLMKESSHQTGCPALIDGALAEIDQLLEVD